MSGITPAPADLLDIRWLRGTEEPDAPSQIIAGAMSPDAEMAALSFHNAEVQVIGLSHMQTIFKFKVFDLNEGVGRAVKQFAWSPNTQQQPQHWRLLGTQPQGGLMLWTPTFGNKSNFIPLDPENQYTTLAYSTSGERVVCAGMLPQIEVYDEHTFQCVHKIDSAGTFSKKKVETVKFFPNSNELYLSASWDASVKFWDCRSKAPTERIYGIQVCGDSLEMHPNQQTVLVGGSGPSDGIQLWDIRNTAKPVLMLDWETDENPVISTCKFVPRTNHILAATRQQEKGSLRVFDFVRQQYVQTVTDVESSCVGFDLVPQYDQILVMDRSAKVSLFDYVSKNTGNWPQSPDSAMETRKAAAHQFVADNSSPQNSSKSEEEEIPIQEFSQPVSPKSPSSNDVSYLQDPLTMSPLTRKKTTIGGLSMKTGTYDLEEQAIPSELQSLRTTNKKRLQRQVDAVKEEVMQEFMRKAEMVQILAEAEINAASSDKPVTTDQFVKQLESYLKNQDLSQSPHIDIEKITKELYEEKSQSTVYHRLPEIKGPIKNVRKLLQEDLIDDGIVRSHIPFSSRHRDLSYSQSKRSVAPSVASINSRALDGQKKQSGADDFVAQYQKNMIVELPEMGDQVAENFSHHWKSPPTTRKYSVQPMDKKSLSKVSSIGNRRLSQQSLNSAIPDKVKQRLPDSDHLQKMRAYLVSVHQNENFVKDLSEDGGLIPTAIKMKLDKKEAVQEKLGDSFFKMLQRNNQELRSTQQRKAHQESGLNEETEAELDLTADDLNKVRRQGAANMDLEQHTLFQKDKDYKPHPSLPHFEEMLAKGDLLAAMELATTHEGLVKESQALAQHRDNIFDSEQLRQNPFFKKFTMEYQQTLDDVMDKGFGQLLNVKLKSRDDPFKNKILSHIGETSHFRKKVPEVFKQKPQEGSDALASKIKNNFKQVGLPTDLRLLREAESKIALFGSPRRGTVTTLSAVKAQSDPLLDPTYLRRLKMANYGRWFMKPVEYVQKVDFINSELKLKK